MNHSPFALRRIPTAAFALLFLLAGAIRATGDDPRVRVTAIPGLIHLVKARRGPDGVVHVVADGPGGPRYARSDDDGVTFGPARPLVVAPELPPGLEFAAEDLAVGPDGRVHVALSSNGWKLKRPQEEWGFYYTQLPPGSDTFAPLRNLNRQPSEGFALTAGSNGLVVASFLSGKLFTQTSTNGGTTFGPAAELNPAWNPCDCCTTTLATGTDGQVALLYREETDNLRDPQVAIWEAGRPATLHRTRLGTDHWHLAGCPMTYFSLAATPAGYLAAWPTEGRVRFSRLDATGALQPPGEIMTPGKTGMRQRVLAVESSAGDVLVAWVEAGTLRWQRYDRAGQPHGATGEAPTTGKHAVGITLPDGRFRLFP